MQVDWLTSFVTIADTGSFHAAASTLFRSQSRISAHIAGLEKALGAELFDRRQRPVRLTDSGEAFLRHARAILDRLEDSQSEIASIRGLRRGRVVLGTYPSTSAGFLPAVLKEFQRKYRGVSLVLAELSFEEMDSNLVNNRVSLSLRPSFPPLTATARQVIAGIELWREPLCVVFPLDHPLAKVDGPISLSELEGEKIITPSTLVNEVHPYVTDDLLRSVIFHTDTPQTLIALTEAGLGLGLANYLALSVSNQSGVRIRQVSDEGAHRDVGLFWNVNAYRSTATDALVTTMISADPPSGTVRLFRP